MLAKKLLISGLILFFTSNIYAVNFQYLRYSPIASFNDEDLQLLQEAGLTALNEYDNGKVIMWKNPETQNSGSITPVNSSTIDGMHCRKVKIINQAKNKYNESQFTFCKVKERWKVLK